MEDNNKEWDKLSMKDKYTLMRKYVSLNIKDGVYVGGGIDDVKKFYDDGGDIEVENNITLPTYLSSTNADEVLAQMARDLYRSLIPTREDYIDRQRQTIINLAILNSEDAITSNIPILPYSNLEILRITDELNAAKYNLLNMGPRPLMRELALEWDRKNELFKKEVQRLSDKLNKGYQEGAACINTATGWYGKGHLVSGNQSFLVPVGETNKWGFQRLQYDSDELLLPGMILLDKSVLMNSPNIPTHAVMFTRYSTPLDTLLSIFERDPHILLDAKVDFPNGIPTEGWPLYSYSPGSGDVVHNNVYSFAADSPNVYRFVGTQKENNQWNNDYNILYGLFKNGGNLYENGSWLSRLENWIRYKTGWLKISDDELADAYLNNVVWTMENPTNEGYNVETNDYGKYYDIGNDKIKRTNIGPGMEKNAFKDVIDYDSRYNKEELNTINKLDILKRIQAMNNSFETMQDGKYAGARDTLSMGPLLEALDLVYNVKPKGKDGKMNNNLPEKWPTHTKALFEGDLEKAKKENYSGSKRRLKMRNDLLHYGNINENTVINRAYGGSIFNSDLLK